MFFHLEIYLIFFVKDMGSEMWKFAIHLTTLSLTKRISLINGDLLAIKKACEMFELFFISQPFLMCLKFATFITSLLSFMLIFQLLLQILTRVNRAVNCYLNHITAYLTRFRLLVYHHELNFYF